MATPETNVGSKDIGSGKTVDEKARALVAESAVGVAAQVAALMPNASNSQRGFELARRLTAMFKPVRNSVVLREATARLSRRRT